jgi:hypothetical protein
MKLPVKSEASLLFSEERAIGPYTEPGDYSPQPRILFILTSAVRVLPIYA